MKSAKTMFEELGFKLYYLGESVLAYRLETDYDKVEVSFELERKSCHISCHTFLEISNKDFIPMNERSQETKHSAKYGRWYFANYPIGADLHNAIHQQMIELGWIE